MTDASVPTTTDGAPPDELFCKRLPKVELHAHLSGSVSRAALQSIYDSSPVEDPIRNLPPPQEALADGKRAGQTIDTFFGLFHGYTYKLLSTVASLRFATRRVMCDFADDGVIYLELRTTPRPLSNGVSAKEAILAVLQEIERWNHGGSNPTARKQDGFEVASTATRMKVFLLLSVDRGRHSPSEAMDVVNLALALRKAGKPVVGVDLSGDPNADAPVSQFRDAFQRARAGDLKLALHFAELPASSTDQELDELLSWKPRRLGHCLYVKPDMRRDPLSRSEDKKVGIEQCISCNLRAGMLGKVAGQPATIKHHPFRDWVSNGAEVSFCTDDVGVFQSPSSQEYWIAAKEMGLTRNDLRNISLRAMDGAFCDEQTKREVQKMISSLTLE